MRVFVTGATGVIGRRLVPLLLDRDYEVTAVARGAGKRAALERRGARPVDVSLFDRAGLEQALTGHDAVVNLATHIPRSTTRMMLMPWTWRENDRIRRDGSAALVDAALAARVPRFIQESYAPAYDDHGARWIDEDQPLRPGRYARTVLDAERSARRFEEAGGGVAVVLRFAAFYGPDARQLRDLAAMVRRGWALLPGPSDHFLSSISHDDAATAVLTALRLQSGTYNVADDQPLPHRDYVDALAGAMGAARHHPHLPPSWATPLLGGSMARMLARSLRISNRRLRDASDWSPRYPSVREGFKATFEAAPALGSPA